MTPVLTAVISSLICILIYWFFCIFLGLPLWVIIIVGLVSFFVAIITAPGVK